MFKHFYGFVDGMKCFATAQTYFKQTIRFEYIMEMLQTNNI